VSSGFGLHLVHVSDRIPARMPELDEVRDEVQRELMSQRRRESVDGLYDKLAENYVIDIEPLTDPAAAGQEGQ
jgi:parvulin-like peptidyl-prolyl isomerase